MSALPAGIAAQMALTQQAVALEVLKQNADMQAKVAEILQDSVAVPVNSARGGSVNISA